MLDRTIPFYNMILRCDCYTEKEIILPDGYEIVTYREGFEDDWAVMECAINDFTSIKEAKDYFVKTYLSQKEKLKDILFILNSNKQAVASCIAWQDQRMDELVSSLHWLVVDENYQGKGLGKALCIKAMNLFASRGQLPVYIHTQPWSYKAIMLYLSIGFIIQKKDSFSHYDNQYLQAMDILQKVVSKQQFNKMLESSK